MSPSETPGAMNYLGIEIGGTKLQLGVGDGNSPHLKELVREPIDARAGARRIREQIARATEPLLEQFSIERIGVGFGGPVDATAGVTTKSHQVDGWENFPLAEFLQERCRKPVMLCNDCDAAALAEHRLGAGQGVRHLLYVTIGTGIGGGLILNHQLHDRTRPAAAEIGHLRPGVLASDEHCTVESVASGWGITTVTQWLLSNWLPQPRTLTLPLDDPRSPLYRDRTWQQWLPTLARRLEGDDIPAISDAAEASRNALVFAQPAEVPDELRASYQEAASQLLRRVPAERLNAETVGQAAEEANPLACAALHFATQTLGWAIAQTINMTGVERVIVGGGVSLLGESLFLQPLRGAVDEFVFPPLRDSFWVHPAALGEEVVVQGGIVLASRLTA